MGRVGETNAVQTSAVGVLNALSRLPTFLCHRAKRRSDGSDSTFSRLCCRAACISYAASLLHVILPVRAEYEFAVRLLDMRARPI